MYSQILRQSYLYATAFCKRGSKRWPGRSHHPGLDPMEWQFLSEWPSSSSAHLFKVLWSEMETADPSLSIPMSSPHLGYSPVGVALENGKQCILVVNTPVTHFQENAVFPVATYSFNYHDRTHCVTSSCVVRCDRVRV